MGLASCQFSFLKRFWFWSEVGNGKCRDNFRFGRDYKI